MKKMLLLMMSSIAIITSTGTAQDINRFEIGVILGEPTGISAKYWMTTHSAIDAAVGWSFSDEVIELSTDYQYHYFLFDLDQGLIPVYLGMGLGLQLGSTGGDDDAFLGIRIPLGAVYLFKNAPFAIFGEVAPIFEVIPETRPRVSGGAGIRFTF
jgi:hypothetical protein